MDPITESFLCSICQHRTARDYHKNLMGGLAGAVCWYCFLAWYEQGKITDESIRQESIVLRHDDAALNERVTAREMESWDGPRTLFD